MRRLLIYSSDKNEIYSSIITKLGHQIIIHEGSSQVEMLDLLSNQVCFDISLDDTEYFDAVIIFSQDIDLSENIVALLQNNTGSLRAPRFIIISDFLNFLNERDQVSTPLFDSRSPVNLNQYNVENLWCSMRLTGFDVCMLSRGLVFGEKGGDFAKPFSSFWNGGDSQEDIINKIPLRALTLKLPTVHISVFIDTVSYFVDTTSSPVSFFCPISDVFDFQQEDPQLLNETLREMRLAYINSLDEAQTKLSSSLSDVVNHLQFLQPMPNISSGLQELPSTSDSSAYSKGLIKNFDTVWSEFTASNGLAPFFIFVCGPPKVGKSNYAQQLSQM